MNKNLYVKKLKNLSEQINIMLMEAEVIPVLSGQEHARKVMQDALDVFGDPNNKQFEDPNSGAIAKWIGQKEIQAYKKKTEFLKWCKDNYETLAKVKKGGIIAAASIAITAAGVIGRAKVSMKRLADNTTNAINSENYEDLSKYVNALKKMSSDSMWNKIITSEEARTGAAKNADVFKKAYIGVGVGMILCSIVALIVMGTQTKVLSDLWEAVKSLNVKAIASSMLGFLSLAVLMMPALVGIALIYIGVTGFPEGGIASKFAPIFAPVIKGCNIVVKEVLEMVQNAGVKSAYVKSLKSTKKVNKLSYLAF